MAEATDTLNLHTLATAVNVSPRQLARVFKANTGLTVGQYRTRIRVRLALERLAEGEGDLSRLANDLGFFDHSHFSRTVTSELGVPPRELRALLDRSADKTVAGVRPQRDSGQI